MVRCSEILKICLTNFKAKSLLTSKPCFIGQHPVSQIFTNQVILAAKSDAFLIRLITFCRSVGF